MGVDIHKLQYWIDLLVEEKGSKVDDYKICLNCESIVREDETCPCN